MAAESTRDPIDQAYPAFLSEFRGKTMLQYWLEQSSSLGANLHLAVSEDDVTKFHVRTLISSNKLPLELHEILGNTAGATCTALLAIANIPPDDSLLILNGNEFLDLKFSSLIEAFVRSSAFGGLAYFESIHPRYSYVRLGQEGQVVEVSEKTPISQHATAGFYWFSSIHVFRAAAERQLMKRSNVNGRYYIAPLFNELILDGRFVSSYEIDAATFKPLKSQRQALDSREVRE